MSKLLIYSTCLTILFGLDGYVRADEVVLDFDSVSDIECGDAWEMENLPLKLLATLDCQSIDTPYGWYIARTCLEIDVRPLADLRTVIVDFRNYHDPGDVYVYLMDLDIPLVTAYCVDSFARELLVLEAGDHIIERVRVCGWAFLLYSTIFRYGPVENEGLTWGLMKTLYK
ncbi:hypothetical protein H8E07_14775 [bacterium]|nr:hypothetical protein [bacterium]